MDMGNFGEKKIKKLKNFFKDAKCHFWINFLIFTLVGFESMQY